MDFSKELIEIAFSLDSAANTNFRGSLITRSLYRAALKNSKGIPLCLESAGSLIEYLEKDDVFYILTGFVLSPSGKAETDGVVGALLLADSLAKALEIKPVIVCPTECERFINAAGRLFEREFDYLVYPKEESEGKRLPGLLLQLGEPQAIMAVECPGRNIAGVYQNCRQENVSALQAKSDFLFEECRKRSIPTFAIGDLGNETGLGTLRGKISALLPKCGCGSNLIAATCADNIITCSVSNWGCYSLISAAALLLNMPNIIPTADRVRNTMLCAVENGIIDSVYSDTAAVDGASLELDLSVVDLMNNIVENALKHLKICRIV